jgi:ribonuclease Z
MAFRWSTASVALALVLAQGAASTTFAQTALGVAPIAQPPKPGDLRVTLLGSGVGPPVNLAQFGASTLVEAGTTRLLFDCGRGATLRLVQAGVPTGSISKVFLTHLHSDHIVQLPDLLITGWVGPGGGGSGRPVPLEVWGPKGTTSMMRALEDAFAFDVHMRRDVDEKLPAEGIKVLSHDIEEGVVFDENGVKVTAFLVDHLLVVPAFGYRVDYRGHSVVLSGDTRPSENLIRHAQGTDVLIHEAYDAVAVRARSQNPAVTEAVIAHHTTPDQAARIFSRVKPRLAVYSHAPATESVIDQTRQGYSGPLEGAEDLLTITIGDEIGVRHFGR